jgi:hypothetical protein
VAPRSSFARLVNQAAPRGGSAHGTIARNVD